MSIKHIGTSIFLNAENHKTIPVRKLSKKLNLLSLLLCLPSAFPEGSLRIPGPGALALCPRTVVADQGHSNWQTSGSGRFTPSFTGSQTATHPLPPYVVHFPELSGHREGP